MTEQEEAGVVVSEGAAAGLAEHLASQNRLKGGVQFVAQTINRAVAKKWGTQAESFTDTAGPGWIVDMSEFFEEELLYAVIRSEHGNRAVVAVVDEDEIGTFKKTGQWVTPAAGSSGLSDAMGMSSGVPENGAGLLSGVVDAAMRPQRQQSPVEPQPNDPRLVVWTERPEGGGDEAHLQVRHCAYSEVQAVVMRLLMLGHKVEVWSDVKSPELKVDL